MIVQSRHDSVEGCYRMLLATTDRQTRDLVVRYVERLSLPTDRLRVTTEKRVFERWLGRRVASNLGGAYAFLPASGGHAVLINLDRIDRGRPRSVEIVVAEELIHMRDRLDGDVRRHAKHGYDRIAERVAALVGVPIEEVRSCLLPPRRRPFRYEYGCPSCGTRVRRRIRGAWSCGRCSTRYDPRFRLELLAAIDGGSE